jgi:hypothetical protein
MALDSGWSLPCSAVAARRRISSCAACCCSEGSSITCVGDREPAGCEYVQSEHCSMTIAIQRSVLNRTEFTQEQDGFR